MWVLETGKAAIRIVLVQFAVVAVCQVYTKVVADSRLGQSL